MQLAVCLAKVDNWQFDAFELERASGGRPLSVLAYALFKRADLPSLLRLDERRLVRCAVCW